MPRARRVSSGLGGASREGSTSIATHQPPDPLPPFRTASRGESHELGRFTSNAAKSAGTNSRPIRASRHPTHSTTSGAVPAAAHSSSWTAYSSHRPACRQPPRSPRRPAIPFGGPARWGREVRPTSQTRVTRIRRYGYCLEASRMGAKDRDAAGGGSVRRSGGSALACERPNWNLSSASFPRSYICAYIRRCAASRPADLNGSAGRWCASSIGGEMPWRGGASFPHA